MQVPRPVNVMGIMYASTRQILLQLAAGPRSMYLRAVRGSSVLRKISARATKKATSRAAAPRT